MLQIIALVISFGILGTHYFLSRRANIYLGAIIPVLYLIFIMVWFLISGKGNTYSMIRAAGYGELLCLVFWVYGRESFKKKREKEFKKIQVKDL